MRDLVQRQRQKLLTAEARLDFVVPVIPLFPLKLVGLWLLTHQYWLSAITTIIFAKLVGVAPIANDSGKRKGKRPVRGGRSSVRSILFLVAAIAARYAQALLNIADPAKALAILSLEHTGDPNRWLTLEAQAWCHLRPWSSTRLVLLVE